MHAHALVVLPPNYGMRCATVGCAARPFVPADARESPRLGEYLGARLLIAEIARGEHKVEVATKAEMTAQISPGYYEAHRQIQPRYRRGTAEIT